MTEDKPSLHWGLHESDGWYFKRELDGSVTIRVTSYGDMGAFVLREHRIHPDSWASIVATVSELGETQERWSEIRRFHTKEG